jgi:hypothetical protein
MTLTEVVKLLRGPAGAKVDVAVWRPGVSKEQSFTLIRESAVAGGTAQQPPSSTARRDSVRAELAQAMLGAAAPPVRERPEAPSQPVPPAIAAAFGLPRAAASLPDTDAPKYRQAQRPDDFALVVGIERYAKLVSAEFAERDASAVRDHLLALGVPQRNVIFLIGQAATRASLQGYLEEWLPKNVKPGSRVYFYYSGHGAPDPKTGDAFLVPWDGDPMFLKSSAYPLRDLIARLSGLGAAEVLVALDSCFSGAGGRSVLAKGSRPLVAKVKDIGLPEGGVSLLTAASGDETTATLEDARHGVFTYHLLRALNEGKRGTKDLYEYLKPRVSDDARRQNREQTPGFSGSDLSF